MIILLVAAGACAHTSPSRPRRGRGAPHAVARDGSRLLGPGSSARAAGSVLALQPDGDRPVAAAGHRSTVCLTTDATGRPGCMADRDRRTPLDHARRKRGRAAAKRPGSARGALPRALLGGPTLRCRHRGFGCGSGPRAPVVGDGWSRSELGFAFESTTSLWWPSRLVVGSPLAARRAGEVARGDGGNGPERWWSLLGDCSSRWGCWASPVRSSSSVDRALGRSVHSFQRSFFRRVRRRVGKRRW